MKTELAKMLLCGYCVMCDKDLNECLAEDRCLRDDLEDEDGTEEKSI